MTDEPDRSRRSGDEATRREGDWAEAGSLLAVFAQPWVVTFVVVHAAGWWIARQQAPVDAFSLPVYALSAACSASFWLMLNLLRDAVGRLGRVVVGFVAAGYALFVVVGSYKVYVEFGEFLSASMVGYAGKGGVSTLSHYVQTYLEYPLDVIFFVGVPVFAALWWLAPRLDAVGRSRRTRIGIVVTVLFVLSLLTTALFAHRRHLSPDVAIFTAGLRSLYMPDDDRLHAAERPEVPNPPRPNPHPHPNIVLVLHESLGTHVVDFSDSSTDDMPYLESWLASQGDRTFAFRRAYANSTSTDISVPTLLTGVGPHEPVEQLYRVPFAWDWARAAGLEPFYVSTQNYSSTDFPSFFFANDPMPVLRPNTIEELGQSGDFSVDELYMAETFGKQLAEMPDDRPIFAVYNSDAMHKPFQENSPRLDEPPRRGSQYRNAMYVLDRAMKRIIESLRREERLANTLFVMTSDHGEYPTRKHRVPRILSAYEEFTRVPMVVRVPTDWPEEWPNRMRALRTNVDRNTANIDVVPTIVDVLGYTDTPAVRELRERITGHSLVAPVPRDRTIVVLNNNAARHWEHRSFGLYWRDWRFVFSDVQGPRLFDIGEDPEQRRDLWGRAPDRIRQRMLRTIRESEPLSEVWKTRRHGTPGFEPVFPRLSR